MSAIPVYSLRRARRRTVAIHLRHDQIEVRAPLRMAQREIDAFVVSKRDWIDNRLAQLRAQQAEQLSLADGATLAVMGETLQLRWRSAVRNSVTRVDDILWLAGRALDEKKAQVLLRQWLAQQAREQLLPRAEALIAAMGLQQRHSGFVLRYTRSQWGRCSARGEILFNPLILLAPPDVMDYLIAHEVCHLRHLDHSEAFWQLAAQVCPHWQQSRTWLREHGHRLQPGQIG